MYLSQTLLFFWLYQKGYGFSDLILYSLGIFAVALVGIIFLPRIKMSAKRAMFLGILSSALFVFVLIKIYSPIQLYLSAIFSGLNVIFFWIPYNTMYFKFSSEEKRGTNSGMYFLITPIIGITLQPLAGVFAEKFGFEIMFLIGFCSYIIPLILLYFLPNFEWYLNIKEEFPKIKFNWSTFFQGAASRINWGLIPIFSLFFLKTPKQFGAFFGYLAIITALASVVNGHISDKIKNRKVFFYLFSFIAVLSLLPLAFVHNIYYWSIFAGIASLCMSLASPFWLTFNLDYYKNLGVDKTMALREVFLNSGYVFTLLVVFLVYYLTSSAKLSLMIISILCCLLPIVSYLQKIYFKKDAE